MAGCPAVLLPHIYEYNNKLVDCVNAVTFYCKRTSLHSVFDKMIVSRENKQIYTGFFKSGHTCFLFEVLYVTFHVMNAPETVVIEEKDPLCVGG